MTRFSNPLRVLSSSLHLLSLHHRPLPQKGGASRLGQKRTQTTRAHWFLSAARNPKGRARQALSEKQWCSSFADRVGLTRLCGWAPGALSLLFLGFVRLRRVVSGVTSLPGSLRQPAPKGRNRATTRRSSRCLVPESQRRRMDNTCVKATARGITGRSIGTQTYLENIEHDRISQREQRLATIRPSDAVALTGRAGLSNATPEIARNLHPWNTA